MLSTIAALAPWATGALSRAISFRSESGAEGPMVEWLAREAEHLGLGVDLWQAEEAELERFAGPLQAHKSLGGRPTLVVRLPGRGGGKSLIFNAHSDVIGAPGPERWRSDPWQGRIERGVMYGRGACDTKGPMVAAMWAMRALAEHGPALDGDLLMEIVPGEEDCVGLGTITSVVRGHRADAAVVLEPTGNMPRCASRAGCRFIVTAHGESVHGTVKWLGRDAIRVSLAVQQVLEEIEARWNDSSDPLFASYPIARPITVDFIRGGDWQGMVCDRCSLAGYLELLPGDDIAERKSRFAAELRAGLERLGWPASSVDVAFTEEYRGHRLSPDSALCRAAEQVISAGEIPCESRWTGWGGFNSGCEAGLRAAVHGTPTLVWGPGDLAHAHAVDERVDLDDVRRAAEMFASLAVSWCGAKEFP